MFKYLESRKESELVSIEIDGQVYSVPKNETVAASLLMLGFKSIRTNPVSGEHRSPFCMMGVCYECLVTIDGLVDQQACMTRVRPGMRIRRQRGPTDIFLLTDASEVKAQ